MAIAACSALALGVAGCGSDGQAAAATSGTGAGDAPADSDTPDPIKVEAYLSGLRDIHPDLALNQDRAVKRAQETCADLKAGQITGAKLNDRVADRLSGDSSRISAKQAARAMELMKTYIC